MHFKILAIVAMQIFTIKMIVLVKQSDIYCFKKLLCCFTELHSTGGKMLQGKSHGVRKQFYRRQNKDFNSLKIFLNFSCVMETHKNQTEYYVMLFL